MPVINWDEHEEAGHFKPVPRGKYLCQVVDVRQKTTKDGNEIWDVQYEIVAPEPYSGRRFFDGLAFTPKALGRVKLACAKMGLDTTGTVELEPKHLQGRKVVVCVDITPYTDRTGKIVEKNTAMYSGFIEASAWEESATPVAVGAEASGQNEFSEENLPF